MTSTEDQIEPANEDEQDEESDDEERQRDNMYDSERDSDNQSTDVGEELWYVAPETDGNVTEDDEGEVEEGKENEMGIETFDMEDKTLANKNSTRNFGSDLG